MVTWGGNPAALAYVLFFGSFYAVPTVIYTAIAHALAITFPRPTFVFLALAALGVVAFSAYLQFGPGHASNKPFHTADSALYFFVAIGIPTFAVIAVYAIGIVGPATIIRRTWAPLIRWIAAVQDVLFAFRNDRSDDWRKR